MELQTHHPLCSSGVSGWRETLRSLYPRWRAWRLRVKTRRILHAMNDERLKDIGLTHEDIDRRW
ncbi:DUF1127 domain-containing protein [Affinibrenneria salicis]|uniref:DUF1127 domain-containing protein n=1 Tax=Affinibrenneria salicis TaxID=2590031 RepID=A0A5J5FQB3_9GAMM|nr:DUF1127 domain-containing protein [Affinibrenneria salicis]KAA8995067.1 DUF1127 domain-containing protein [Affinibrenneria salicis]